MKTRLGGRTRTMRVPRAGGTMADVRCERCDLLVGLGCACGAPQRGRRGRAVRGAKRAPRAGEVTLARQKGAASGSGKGRQTGKGTNAMDADLPPLDEDRMAVEETREELRDIWERGSSVRTFSGGLPTLGRRRR